MGQTQTGSTDNVIVGQSTSTGEYSFLFNDPFDMLINLNNSSSIVTDGSTHDDKFNLMNSSDLIINGNNGNDIFNISATAGGLNGTVIHGGTGYNFITMAGSNTAVDLTGSNGITAVVGNKFVNGESVSLALNQISTSALTDGGTGRAFVAAIGTDGIVNLTQSGKFVLVGSLNATGAGFDASGNAITGTALTSLQSHVTSISNITGNLAALYGAAYNGGIPANETAIKSLNAYVLSDGTKYYTVWSDGTVNSTNSAGTTTTFYQPTATTPAGFTYNSVSMFSKSGTWAGANLYTNAAGTPDLQMLPGNTTAASAINLSNGVTGLTVHGDSGLNGANYFGLGGSGGNNTVYGSKAGNTFDLMNSTSLKDMLVGGIGFDVVKATANGTDVDLTANNGNTGIAAKSIDAVVASPALANIQTVEVDPTTLRTVKDASGVNSAVFSAMLGSSADTLTVTSSKGMWIELGSFAPGSALPTHAQAIQGADVIDSIYHNSQHTAATSLTGHLYERVDGLGHVLEYLTVYSDATVVNALTPATAKAIAAAHPDYLH